MSLDLIAASATFPGLATAGTQTIAGDKTFTGTSTIFTSQIFMNDTASSKAIRFQANTVDGTDDYRLLISSGGGAGPGRGAYVEMHGNEFSSTPGRVLWESGSAASGSAIAWQVNVGASSVLGHSINGNGLSVIGPTGSLGTVTGHQIYGPLLSQISSAIPQMSISAADRGYIGCNIYLDSAGGAKRSIVNAVGYSFLQLDRSATSTDTCFRVVANNDTQTNGVAGATVTTNEKTVFQATFAGGCTFGAGTSSLVTHTFYCANATFTSNNGGASNNWIFENSNTGNGGSYIYIKAYKAAGGGSAPTGVILQNIANGATVGTYIRNEGATSSGIYFTTWNAGVEQISMTSTGDGRWNSNYLFGSSGGFGGVKTSITTTPVSIFPAYTAQSCMVIICGNNAGGTSTTVGVYVLRGYADNSTTWTSTASTAIQLVQQGVGSFTFGVSGTDITIASGGGGNWTCQVLGVGSY